MYVNLTAQKTRSYFRRLDQKPRNFHINTSGKEIEGFFAKKDKTTKKYPNQSIDDLNFL